MNLSRRDFLKVFGIAAVGQINLPLLNYPTDTVIHGRALLNLPIFAAADNHSAILRQMWSDEIFKIHEQSGIFFRTSEGYVLKDGVQPLINKPRTLNNMPIEATPDWAEVIAPVSVVRAYCAPDAPIVTRIGHGGIMKVASQLTMDDDTIWYELSTEDNDVLGWAEAIHWDTVAPSSTLNNVQNQQITLSRQSGQLQALKNGLPVFMSKAKLNSNLARGSYQIQRKSIGGVTKLTAEKPIYGVPHILEFDDRQQTQLFGAYWHNQFGTCTEQATIEVNIHTAKWLYCWLDNATTVVVA